MDKIYHWTGILCKGEPGSETMTPGSVICLGENLEDARNIAQLILRAAAFNNKFYEENYLQKDIETIRQQTPSIVYVGLAFWGGSLAYTSDGPPIDPNSLMGSD